MSKQSTARLRAAVRAIDLRALDFLNPITPGAHPPEPAQTRQNLPEPASSGFLQNEPTAPRPSSIRHQPSSPSHPLPPAHSVPNFQTNPPNVAHSPAKTRQNPPKPATRSAPAQNEPTAPSSILHAPSSSPPVLTPRQRHAARLLIVGHTAKSVAAQLDVNRHTVSQWKKLPDFQHELTRLLNDLAPRRRVS
jgi:hypothetical protein